VPEIPEGGGAIAGAKTDARAATELPGDQSEGIGTEEYLISPDDVLDVYVLDVPELSRSYRVSMTGEITVPMLDHPVRAIGLTLDSFAKVLENDLRQKGLVSNPHISVTVKTSRFHAVAITGAVKTPQVFPLLGRTTLLDVIAAAGGVTQNAGAVVRITRGPIAMRALHIGNSDAQSPAQEMNAVTVTLDLKRLLETSAADLNPPIFPGDKITVPVGGVIYVVGAVNKPGGWVLSTDRQDMTVLQALALAEDAKPTARRDRASIVRRDSAASGGHEYIPVNLSEIISGKAPDVGLKPNDILFVPDSSGKKAMHRGAEAALQLITGIAIWGH
jgi:polysaccharide export outer membrane protein